MSETNRVSAASVTSTLLAVCNALARQAPLELTVQLGVIDGPKKMVVI